MIYLCPLCHGHGCTACNSATLRHRMLLHEAQEFLLERLPSREKPDGDIQIKLPGSYRDVLLLVAAAIQHGRQEGAQETEVLPELIEAPRDRFALLEIEDVNDCP